MIGISLLTLVPGVVGGSETYARELTRALARVGELDYRVLLPSIAADAHGGLPSTVVSAYNASPSMPGRARAMARAAVVPTPIVHEMGVEELDAIHFPLTVMLPKVDRPPAATTILDVAHELVPSSFSPLERAYRRRAYGWTARRSRLVIAISEHAAETLVERLGVVRQAVRVIPLGVDHERFRPDGSPRKPFLLYPANGWPHKNHHRLLQAFALVRREHPDLSLVLTGSGLERLRVQPGVETRGRVSHSDLVSLYRTASALVFPSLYEGFGLPPLEAMACGCPVAVSLAGALPEVCGDAAVYFDPTSAEAIAAGILEALARAPDLSARAIRRAAGFTWDECARRHESAYKELQEMSL